MNAHKTAISRKTASKPTKDMLKNGRIWGRVLDYGCGKGMDTKFLLSEGFEVLSYDPYYEPTDLENAGKFDTVICNYVFNVMESKEARVELLKLLVDFLNVGGKLIITARPEKEIKTAAVKGGWVEHADGYVTGKQTFQKGFNDADFAELLELADIKEPYRKLDEIKSNSSYTVLALQRLKFYPED